MPPLVNPVWSDFVDPVPKKKKNHCSLDQGSGLAVPQLYRVTVLGERTFTTVFKKLNSYLSEWF